MIAGKLNVSILPPFAADVYTLKVLDLDWDAAVAIHNALVDVPRG